MPFQHPQATTGGRVSWETIKETPYLRLQRHLTHDTSLQNITTTLRGIWSVHAYPVRIILAASPYEQVAHASTMEEIIDDWIWIEKNLKEDLDAMSPTQVHSYLLQFFTQKAAQDKSASQTALLLQLPDEIMFHICSFLDVRSQVQMLLTCQQCKSICDDPLMWAIQCKRLHLLPSSPSSSSENNKNTNNNDNNNNSNNNNNNNSNNNDNDMDKLWEEFLVERFSGKNKDENNNNNNNNENKWKQLLKESLVTPWDHPGCRVKNSKGSKIRSFFWSKSHPETRCLLVGPRASGKTTLLYKLKLGELVTTIPTKTFNIERVEYRGRNFDILDFPDLEAILSFKATILREAEAIIFTVDSTTRDVFTTEAVSLFTQLITHRILADKLKNEGVPLLVFCNKQDLPQSMSVSEIVDHLGLHSARDIKRWYIQAACAPTGDGLYEGLDWLWATLKDNKNDKIKKKKQEKKIF
jgi:ADP-ribosylation factor protein 1